jgi:hypothetical protein
MTGATVMAVVILSVPRQKPPHNGGYALVAASKKEVGVVVHEDPSVDKALAFNDILAEAIEETDFVLVVFENSRSVDPADHDVMQGTGDI